MTEIVALEALAARVTPGQSLAIPVDGYYSEAEAIVDVDDGAQRVARIIVKPTIIVRDEAARAKVQKVLTNANRDSLVANTLSASVIVEPNVVVA